MNIIEYTLRKETNDFKSGYTESTLMGWTPEFDDQGRPLNADPNYRSGKLNINNITYYYIRRRWEVRVWDVMATYMDFMKDDDSYILKVNLTPDYLKTNV